MYSQTETLWLPGLAGLAIYLWVPQLAIWMGLHFFHFKFSIGESTFLVVPFFMFFAMGALATYWSKRAGGRIRERILAALLPLAFFTTLSFSVLLLRLLGIFREVVVLDRLAITMLLVIPISAAALFLGALPFLRGHCHEPK